MVASIPASAIVSVTPGVISAGGSALDLNGMVLTNNPRVPIGQALSFPSSIAVASFFGESSAEAAVGTVYFLGFTNSNVKPGALLFWQYASGPVSAYLRGGSVKSLTLTQLQALSGTLVVTIDGVVKTSGAINLTAATSPSNAAALISTSLAVSGPVGAVVVGSITGTTFTVTGVTSGALAIGQTLSGGTTTAGTTITGFLTGTGGIGTYTVSTSQTVVSGTITATNAAVVYDSVSAAFVVSSASSGAASTIGFGSGTIASGLALTQATGATLSQGAIAATPGSAMNALVAQTQNWASFMTMFKPSIPDMIAFAAWTNGTVDRYAYVMWDNDITATEEGSTTSAGAQIIAADYSGTIPMYEPTNIFLAAFQLGAIASIDFTETNGRTNMKFRGQTGLLPGVTDQTIAANLEANGYNYYGQWATANSLFQFLSPGSITGPFDWTDSYVNQIWLNNAFQLAILSYMTSVKSMPYNDVGYASIEAACMDPINQGLNFGAFYANVPLSAAQVDEVNNAAGLKIDSVLSTRGWYLQILPATPQVRAARGSPPCTFWYMDGESINKINLASINVQ